MYYIWILPQRLETVEDAVRTVDADSSAIKLGNFNCNIRVYNLLDRVSIFY